MNVDIAERLAKRRREAGFSQESLAEKLGVSRQAVSKWERSESSPDTDNLIALAQLYGVSLDELLYVDESFKEDVEFEAADRAAERTVAAATAAGATGAVGAEKPPSPYNTQTSTRESAPDVPAEESASKKKNVTFGPEGIHLEDGGDYVHVSWREGVHVNSHDGDEVHVAWDGVHVREGRGGRGRKRNESFRANDNEGNSVHWDGGGVVVNGREYDSWREARNDFNEKHGIGKAWLRFPFPLVVVIAYLMLGVFVGSWGLGIFLFFLIPLYYIFGHVIHTKNFASFFAGLYPVLAMICFLYMAFVMNQPHPAWVIFLTIPLVEWFIHAIARSNRRRKKEAEVIDVGGRPEGE